ALAWRVCYERQVIASQRSFKWIQITDSAHNKPVVDNLLDRECSADQVGQKWVSDITYRPSRSGWLYLTTVMDLADRHIPFRRIGRLKEQVWPLSTKRAANVLRVIS